MDRKNLHSVLGITFAVTVSVVIFVESAAVHGLYAPRTESGEIINLGQSVFNDYKDITEFALERGFVVTGDKTNPTEHNEGSLHPKGLAIDIRTRDHTPEDVEEFMLEAKAAGLRVLDERCRPKKQKKWKGSHVHLEISKKRSTNQKGKCKASRPTQEEKLPTPPPSPPPPPPPPSPPSPAEVTNKVAITSASCELTEQNSYSQSYTVTVSGTASGPPGTNLYSPWMNTLKGTTNTSSWGNHTSNQTERSPSDPETTDWTSKIILRNSQTSTEFEGTVTVQAVVTEKYGGGKVTDSRDVTCY